MESRFSFFREIGVDLAQPLYSRGHPLHSVRGQTMDKLDPIYLLRQKIRQAKKEYRHVQDTSQSVFHPAMGIQEAYDVQMVEAALNEYERATKPSLVSSSTASVFCLASMLEDFLLSARK
jgi:hypothetical protein